MTSRGLGGGVRKGAVALAAAVAFAGVGSIPAFAAVAAAPATAALAPLPNLGAQATVTRLASGGIGIVRPLAGSPVAAIELWYRAPSTGFGTKPLPSLARVAAQVVAASKPLVGLSLGDVVRKAGGRLDITVYSDSVSITALVPSAAARTVVRAITTDYYAPVATTAGFALAQREVSQEAFFSAFDPQTAVRDAVFEQLFSTSPQHYPAEGSALDIGSLTFDAVRAFATRAFRAQNSVLVISGAVDAGVVSAAVAGRPSTDPAAEMFANAPLATAPGPVTKPFVEPSGGYGWVGPPISDTRAATALDFVADYLFRPEAGTVARSLTDSHPDAFVAGQFITLNDPGVMVIVYSGKSPDLRPAIDTAVAALAHPLDPAVFKSAIASFRGHLLADLQTPRQLADNFGWYAVEGNPEYAPGANGNEGAYFTAAASLTPEFVAQTVQAYLSKTPVIVSLLPNHDSAKRGQPALAPAPAGSAAPMIHTPHMQLPAMPSMPAPASSGAPAMPAPSASGAPR